MNKKKKNVNKKHRRNKQRVQKIRLGSLAKVKKPTTKKVDDITSDSKVVSLTLIVDIKFLVSIVFSLS